MTSSPSSRRNSRNIAAGIALAAFVLFLVLGGEVDRFGEPSWLLGIEHATVGHAIVPAWWLTQACYPYVLGPLAGALLLVAWRFPAWRGHIAFSLILLLLCWGGADAFQHLFGRPRRLDWVFHRETSFSYPSSHAAVASGFYGLWALWLQRSNLPGKIWPALLLAALTIAICLSRLALGAHYVTDLIGGILLAIALVSAGAAAAPIKLFGSPFF